MTEAYEDSLIRLNVGRLCPLARGAESSPGQGGHGHRAGTGPRGERPQQASDGQRRVKPGEAQRLL
jgi:hypothetical protein